VGAVWAIWLKLLKLMTVLFGVHERYAGLARVHSVSTHLAFRDALGCQESSWVGKPGSPILGPRCY
jgi:hypothetical protein